MSKLFENTEINGMKLANRFVRSATWLGMASEDGACTPRLMERIAELARGEIGLIISSHAYVREDGKAGIGQTGIYSDALIPGLRDMTSVVHDHGGSIICQITHGGFFANPKLTRRPVLAASKVEGFAKGERQEMTQGQISALIDDFGRAALRAREAGFDGIQIHSAHGYLFSQFISPVFNIRTDHYGGPLENRARALLETVQRARGEVGRDFPILVKLNCDDHLEGGLTMDESLRMGTMLEENGIDAIEVSGGTFVSGKLGPSRAGVKTEDAEAYFREGGMAFKESLDIPIILVGGNRSFELSERLVEDGHADYISMSRPFIREPGLVRRWKEGDRRRAACVSDNLCFGPGMEGKGVYCVTAEREKGRE